MCGHIIFDEESLASLGKIEIGEINILLNNLLV